MSISNLHFEANHTHLGATLFFNLAIITYSVSKVVCIKVRGVKPQDYKIHSLSTEVQEVSFPLCSISCF